jgi:general secretion pathway protein G
MIELLVTLAIAGLILTLAAPRYFSNIDRAREDVLREDLYILRDAIDKFYADRNVYPAALEDLVKEKYLRAIPVDPLTSSAQSWILVPPEDATLGAVANVRSGAPNKGRDGKPFVDW